MNTRNITLVALLTTASLVAAASITVPNSDTYVYKWKRLGWIPKSLINSYKNDYGRYAVAFDEARNICVLFDGYHTYTWDGTNVRSLGRIGPGAKYGESGDFWSRSGASIAYIEHTGKTVLFGGDLGNSGGPFCANDTWEWDGVEWKYLPIPGPRGRAAFKIVYDRSRKEAILFGGYVNRPGPDPYGYVGNTWSYDGTGWRRVATTGPSGRDSFGMAYDSERRVIVLHGGSIVYRVLRDTWEWDGSSWTKRSSKGPRRAGHSLVYDPVLKKCVLFGGFSAINPTTGASDESSTWTWDGNQWACLSVKAKPVARHSHGAIYSPQKKGVVIFGGEYTPGEYLQDNRSIWLLKYRQAEK